MRKLVKVERLCGWHGMGFDRKGYVSLGYWLVIYGKAIKADDELKQRDAARKQLGDQS